MRRVREYVEQHQELQSKLKRLRDALAEGNAKLNKQEQDAKQIALQIVCDSLYQRLVAKFGTDVIGMIRVEYNTYNQLKYPQFFIEYKPLQAAELYWGINPRTYGEICRVNIVDFCFGISDKRKKCIHKYQEVEAKKMASAIDKQMDQLKQIFQRELFEGAYSDASKVLTYSAHGWIMEHYQKEDGK